MIVWKQHSNYSFPAHQRSCSDLIFFKGSWGDLLERWRICFTKSWMQLEWFLWKHYYWLKFSSGGSSDINVFLSDLLINNKGTYNTEAVGKSCLIGLWNNMAHMSFGAGTEILALLSISKISYHCHPVWFNRSLQSCERTSNASTIRGLRFKQTTKESLLFHNAIIFQGLRCEMNKKELRRIWSQRKKRHTEAGLSRGSSLVEIEPQYPSGLVAAADTPTYKETL